MQNKTSKNKLYTLIALVLVFAGMLSFMLSSGNYFQGTFVSNPTDRGDVDLSVTQSSEGLTSSAENAANTAEGYATDAEAALADAEAAYASGDQDALTTAQASTESAADAAEQASENAQSYADKVLEIREEAETRMDTFDAQEAALGDEVSSTFEHYSEVKSAYDEYAAVYDANQKCWDDGGSNCNNDYPWVDYQLAYVEIAGLDTNDYGAIVDDLYAAYQEALDEYTNFRSTESYAAAAEAVEETKAHDELGADDDYWSDIAQEYADQAAEYATAARGSDYAADLYTLYTCTGISLDPSSYEMLEEDTTAEFDITVTVSGSSDSTSYRPSSFAASLLAVTEEMFRGIDNSWEGTVVVASDGTGVFNDATRTDNPFEEIMYEPGSLTLSFSGGSVGETISAYVLGEETLCSSSFTITQAAGGSTTRDPDELHDLTDTDSDGLTDKREILIGSDPEVADTDGDGTSDGDEVTAGTDPLVDESRGSGDTDGDGLTDDEEVALGTDFRTADTDGDGYNDGDEVTESTDPLDSASYPVEEPVDDDSDDDGLTDEEEATLGTDPLDSDTDDDSLTDDLEVTFETDPTTSDTDSDGLSDYEEIYTYLTDPLDEDSDGDGDEDGTEVSAGTDPLDSSDYTVTTTVTTDEVPTLTRDIILSAYTCSDSFVDTKGEWHEDIICRAKTAGWVKGYSDYVFGPDGDITRAEWVKVLTKVFGMDEDDIGGLSTDFLDVSSSDWYYPYVLLAEDADTIRTRDSGYYFNPNDPITRADAILWAIRMAGQSTYSYDIEAVFSDVENEDYFAYALSIANSTEVDTADDLDQPIVEGYTDGTFGPYKNIARSEAMAIATRVAIAWGVASADWDE